MSFGKTILTGIGILMALAANVSAADEGNMNKGADAVKEFDLQGFINGEIAAGRKEIVVPPGKYKVRPRNKEHLALKDLKDVTIIADNVEMICTETTRAVSIYNNTNLTLRGLTIDYDPLPFTEGRITKISDDKKILDIELIEGYAGSATVQEFKFEIFSKDTMTLRTHDYGFKVEKVDTRHIRVIKNGANPNDLEQVGDIIVIGNTDAPGGSIPHAIESGFNKNLRLEGITLYASNCFGFLEFNCDGSTYYRCKIDRRSPESDIVKRAVPRARSLNADAYHSKHAIKGPAYIECSARFMGDDCVNICGEYYMVMSSKENVLRVLARRDINIESGDPVELYSFEGRRLPDAKVAKIEAAAGKATDEEKEFIGKLKMDAGTRKGLCDPGAKIFSISLEKPVDMPMGSLICSMRRNGNGFLVKGCDFGFNRSRGILIKASDGEVTGNRLEGNWQQAIMVSPEYWWLESGSSNNVVIRDNVIKDCRSYGIAVFAFSGSLTVAPSGAHSNIRIEGNTLTGCPLPNILATSTNGLFIKGNRLSPSASAKVPEWVLGQFGLVGKTPEPVMEINCENVIME